jgi:mono/diheme cytochrome c family protein
MVKDRKILGVLLSMGVVVAGWNSVAWSADAKTGKAVYDKSCASCHGADGKGNPAMAKVLGEKGLNLTTPEVKKMSDEQVLKIIVEGAGKMPAQKNLSKDDQKQVLGYTRSLAK